MWIMFFIFLTLWLVSLKFYFPVVIIFAFFTLMITAATTAMLFPEPKRESLERF